MCTDDLVEGPRRYDKKFGRHGARRDRHGGLRSRPHTAGPGGLRRGLYRFFPDIVDHGVGSAEALEDAVDVTERVHLCWD